MTWFQLLESYRPNPLPRGSQLRAVRRALIGNPIMAPHEVRRIDRHLAQEPSYQDLGFPDAQRSSLPTESQFDNGEIA